MATHRELITAVAFDKKFKNALRNYYVYGFFNAEKFADAEWETAKKDWERLGLILEDYSNIKWSGDRKKELKKVMYLSMDSQAVDVNPFHSVYRHCLHKERDIAFFLHAIAALSDGIYLSGMQTLVANESALFFKKRRTNVESEYCRKVVENVSQWFDVLLKIDGCRKEDGRIDLSNMDCDILDPLVLDVITRQPMTTAKLICFYHDSYDKLFSGENKTYNNHYNKMKQLGILECIQEREGANRRWKLPALTLQSLLDTGAGATSAGKDFAARFTQMLDFYTRYFWMGEAGMYVTDRMGGVTDSAFRFKHTYFMHALNDFYLLDLLMTMERGNWCVIRYVHATTGKETKVLCFPLEIRVSAMSGREFLMYYEPFSHSLKSLRLEFIDEIAYLSPAQVANWLAASEAKIGSGGKTRTEANPMAKADGIRAQLDADIKTARKIMRHMWGVSGDVSLRKFAKTDAGAPTGAAAQEIPAGKMKTVELMLHYDAGTESYIRSRLEMEKRNGSVKSEDGLLSFRIAVTDPVEMHPWIRSFYGRIVSAKGTESKKFSIGADAAKMKRRMETEPVFAESEKTEITQTGMKLHSQKNSTELLDGKMARTHEQLFNETFGMYYHVMTEAFMALCAYKGPKQPSDPTFEMIRKGCKAFDNCGRLPEDEAQILVGNVVAGLVHPSEKSGVVKKILAFFTENKFLEKRDNDFVRKYTTSGKKDFYREILPLSEVETRWLLTILGDARARDFLSAEEIAALQEKLTADAKRGSQKAYPQQLVCCYDAKKVSRKQLDLERNVLPVLLAAIRTQHAVTLKYRSKKGNVFQNTYEPVVLEYSARDNCFRGYFRCCADGRFREMALSRICDVHVAEGQTYDRKTLQEEYEAYRSRGRLSVSVAFYDVKNLPDRILTEFAPWEKKCTYNKKTGLYDLTIFYDEKDKAELTVRLMGYGADLYFTDKYDEIRQDIYARVCAQTELTKETANC